MEGQGQDKATGMYKDANDKNIPRLSPWGHPNWIASSVDGRSYPIECM
jgi:hypothetical protein